MISYEYFEMFPPNHKLKRYKQIYSFRVYDTTLNEISASVLGFSINQIFEQIQAIKAIDHEWKVEVICFDNVTNENYVVRSFDDENEFRQWFNDNYKQMNEVI